ncbi:hypothetical protein [Chlorogloeopsis sp. ULAP02]|uniref:hypothetical protein n=1 Tax=Chlorogloeopsis sp. ULAP02 TaxID=3107926 RepID=UPI003136ACF8
MTNTITAPSQRIFDVEQLVQFLPKKATVTEVVITKYSSIAVGSVHPGQEVPALAW